MGRENKSEGVRERELERGRERERYLELVIERDRVREGESKTRERERAREREKECVCVVGNFFNRDRSRPLLPVGEEVLEATCANTKRIRTGFVS